MLLKVPCPRCGKVPPPPCDCPPLPPGPPDPGDASRRTERRRAEIIGLRRERRRGRSVIVVEGFPGDVDLSECASALKRTLGCGGTVKERSIEIQGDHREAIEAFLRERGFRTRRTGG